MAKPIDSSIIAGDITAMARQQRVQQLQVLALK